MGCVLSRGLVRDVSADWVISETLWHGMELKQDRAAAPSCCSLLAKSQNIQKGNT